MIPCLYASTEAKFDHNGIGKLADAQSCIVTEKRNGSFELEMVYPADGIHAEQLEEGNIILPEIYFAGILLQRNHSSIVTLSLCTGADILCFSSFREVHAFFIRQIRSHGGTGQLQGRHGGGNSSRITLRASKRIERLLDELCRVRLVDPGCDEQLSNLDGVEGRVK